MLLYIYIYTYSSSGTVIVVIPSIISLTLITTIVHCLVFSIMKYVSYYFMKETRNIL